MEKQAQPGDNSQIDQIELLRHWQYFRKGLLLFVIGVLFIIAGYKWHALLQLPGLILLLPALFLAARGYWGILKFRLRKSFTLRQK